MAKTDMEKLEILLKHWVEHNEEHAGEFEAWAEKAKALGHVDAHADILSAVESMRKANEHLLKALENLS
ncbi:hypothetical protein H8E77_30345 [bacterium]|nr:hypothetical protein [bacterium]